MTGVPCLLALDLGTTTCRCLAFDLDGHVLSEASRELTLICPAANLAEEDPEEWWSASAEVLGRVMEEVTSLSARPLAIGLTGLKHAIVSIDDRGRAMGQAMLWMDGRCQPQVDWLNREAQDILQATLGPGTQVTSTPSPAKLRWLAENEPDRIAATHSFLLPKDYIRYRLTGVLATDPSDAAGAMLYDPRSASWSPALLGLAGIDLAQLPPIKPPCAVSGCVLAEAAKATGLPEGLPAVVGAGDVQATLRGMGGGKADWLGIYLGTAAWISLNREGEEMRLWATATTGAALRWLRDLLAGPGGDLAYAELMAEAAEVPAGAEGLVFLPHLCGERAPFYDPALRGSVLGLSLRHGRGHLARAVLEGCACHLRSLVEAIQGDVPERIVAVGGGARSSLWVQILADILRLTLWVPEVVEAGAMGAAILASVGVRTHATEAEATARMVRLQSAYVPDQETGSVYEHLYERFCRAESEVTVQHARYTA